MKFRDYGEVKPVTLSAFSEKDLDVQIDALGECQDVIDLQFSTTNDQCGRVLFSALALVSKQGAN